MPKGLTDDQLVGLIERELSSARAYSTGGELSKQRAKALDFYYGRAVDELVRIEGRSSVVSTDVADTIEWIMPSLIRVFAAGDEVCKFEPHGPEDEQAAKQATEYVNWIFSRDNEGFLILYTAFKDALLQKNGIMKVWWENAERTLEEPLREPLSETEAELLRGQ